MKLFLASSASSLRHLTNKVNLDQKTVWFIADAADPYLGTEFWDIPWIDEDRQFFVSQWCKITEFSFKEKKIESFLSSIDIIHISGGSVWYLSELLMTHDHIPIIQEFVMKKWLLYSWTSAWAMIAAHSVDMYVNHAGDPYEPIGDIFLWLWLTNFFVLPHSNRAESIPFWQAALTFLPENQDSLISLRDGQAIWAEWELFNLLS
jgi:peptidase E